MVVFLDEKKCRCERCYVEEEATGYLITCGDSPSLLSTIRLPELAEVTVYRLYIALNNKERWQLKQCFARIVQM